MLLRPAYLGITNTFALLRLLPGSDRDKDAEILALRHQLAVLHRQLTDPRLCAAIVDRLTFGGNIIETGTDSYRLAQTRARTEQTTRTQV